MSTPETSAIVWGNRQLSYNIRRSARRKKTVAVTVEPSGSVLVIAPERLATRPARRDCDPQGGMDRATPPACGRPGSARFAARVRQRGECPVPGAALPLEGRSARDRRGKAARRMAARARAGGNAADRSRASRFGVLVPPSRRRTASGTGGGMAVGRWVLQCPASSSRTNRNAGEAATSVARFG